MQVFTQFEKKPLLFSQAEFIISSFDSASFAAAFAEMERALKQGYYLAGFFSYEAGYCFEEVLRQHKQNDFPLLYFGAYKQPKACAIQRSEPLKDFPQGLRLNITRQEYASNINIIRNYIACGDVYQITYCIKLLFKFQGQPLALYNRLLKEQPVPYPAFVQTDKFSILSLSPEMFLKKNSNQITAKPMKGTWPAGCGLLAGLISPLRLKYDAKNRAENVMIADLLRNDLGRVGRKIKAPTLFEVARYKTLCQMTSTVKAQIDKQASLWELFSAVFPSGSVTGAPKIRAMEIIRQLEREERKIYTGAIGYITPQKDMFFNIPIRTLLIQGQQGEMGIGGGIVWDSTPDGEWNEGLLKAKFFTHLEKGR